MGKQPWWQKIKYRVLVLGLLLSVLPLLILGGINIYSAWGELEQNIFQQNMTSARWIAREIHHQVAQAINTIEVTLASASELIAHTPARQEIVLNSLMKKVSDIEEIILLDSREQVLAVVSKRELTAGKPVHWQPEHLPEETAVGTVFFAPDHRPLFNIYFPLRDHLHNRRTGSLIVQVNLRGLMQRVLTADKAGYYFVVDRQGRLIGHEDFSQVLAQAKVDTNAAVQKLLAGVSPLEIREPLKYTSHNNLLVLGAFAPVQELGWGVVIEQPLQEALVPIYHLLYRFLGAMGGVALIVSGLSILLGLSITRPIEKLEAGVRVVAAGNLDHIIDVKSTGEIAHLVDAFNKMTVDLKNKSLSLLREKELLEKVVSGVELGLALADDREQIIWATPRLRSWFAPQDLLGQQFTQVFVDHRESAQRRQADQGLKEEVFTMKEADGYLRYFRRQVFELGQNKAEDPKFLILMEDITQRQEMEAMVIQADKLAAVGLLASGIAHEINNPLAVIGGYAQDILDRLAELEAQSHSPVEVDREQLAEIRDDMKVIQKQVARCGLITGNLLKFSRQSDWEWTLVDVNQIVTETLSFLTRRFQKAAIQVKTELPAALPLITASAAHLQQVLLNLLMNAFDALPEGGEIKISTAVKDHWLQVEIQDNGMGIGKQDLAKVFDPFYTTKPVGKGTGLGLSICYGIVSNLKGKIKINSEEDKGTKVTILLPLEQEKMEETK